MDKITREVAEAEVNSWLDYKKIGQEKRETYKKNIDNMVEAIMDGWLMLQEDKTFKHLLKFEVGEEKKVTELSYTPRITVSKINTAMKGVPSNDGDARILAYAHALTGTAKGILSKLDTEDYNISQAIVLFFL